MSEWKFIIGMGLIGLFIFGIYYAVDRGSCEDKAFFYGSKVTAYSFVKNYCFVNIAGKAVNLENYRDIVEVK